MFNEKSLITPIIFGFALTFIGLVLFFLGAETGFMPVATKLGKYFGGVAKDDLLLFIQRTYKIPIILSSQKYGIDPNWIAAKIRRENGNSSDHYHKKESHHPPDGGLRPAHPRV